jgi:DNA-binding beta-propeller fold protein YncE
VAFSPDDGLLAVANRANPGTLSLFSVDPSTGSPFAAGDDPYSVAYSPDGGLLAVTNPNVNTMTVLSVDPITSALT